MRLTARHIRLLLSTLMLGLSAAVADAQIGTGSSGPFWPVMTADEQAVAPSPEAASLAGYTDAVVDLASGQGSLSYDLLQWQVGGYAMKLGLSYRIGAFTTEEEAGWIALGWNLTGTGAVTRTVMGQPDELREVEIRRDDDIDEDDDAVTYFQNLLHHRKDADYDRYSYSFPGGSGSFIIKGSSIVELPKSDNKIEFIGVTTEGVRDFRITAPDGTAYEFCEREHSDYRYRSVCASHILDNPNYRAVTTWHLSRIITPEGADTIRMTYAAAPTRQRSNMSDCETVTITTCSYPTSIEWGGGSAGISSTSVTDFKDLKILSGIVSRTGSVTVTHTESQDDRIFISSMKLRAPGGNTVREVTFSGRGGRRRLLDLFEIRGSGGVLLESEKFSYYAGESNTGPGDLFNYANASVPAGKNASATVVDESTGRFNPSRRPDFNSAVGGALRRTESSTGIVTDYTYEANSIPRPPAPSWPLSSPRKSPGFNPDFGRLDSIPMGPPGGGGDLGGGSDPGSPPNPTEYVPLQAGETDSLITIGIRIKSIAITDKPTGVQRTRRFTYEEGMCNIDLNRINESCFLAATARESYRMYGFSTVTIRDYTVSVLSGARNPGVGLSSARIYYGKVSETMEGTGIDVPILTTYEFDTSDASLSYNYGGRGYDNGGNRRIIPYTTPMTGAPYGNTLIFRLAQSVGGYFKEHIGSEPRLKRTVQYEYDGTTGYRPLLENEYLYKKLSSNEVTAGLFFEPIVADKVSYMSGLASSDIQSAYDVSYFNVRVEASRYVCDSVRTLQHFPGGEQRERTVKYRYACQFYNPNFHRFQPGDTIDLSAGLPEGPSKGAPFGPWWADTVKMAGNLIHPVRVITREGGITTEENTLIADIVVSDFYRGAVERGLRTLPVAQMWIVSDGERADTLMRRYEYGRFAGHGGSLLTLPTAIITARRGCEPIDVQRIGGYTAYGRPVTVTQTGKPVMHYTWGYAGDLLTGVTAGGSDPNGPGTQPQLSSSFEHIPLVGCSRMVNPSGMVRQYGYTGGRLTSVSDGSGKVLQQYGYELYAQGASPAARRNCITASQLLGDGSAMAVTRQYYNGFGAVTATLTEGLGGDGGDVAAVTELDALMRPVRQWVPLPLSASGLPEALRSDNALLAASRDFYGDIYGYSELTYAQSSDSRAVTAAAAGAGYAGHSTLTRYTCSNPADAIRKVTRWRLGADGLPVKAGEYGAGELDCTDVTDGDGRRSLTVTDAAGRTVLQRAVADDGTYADTYYITDGPGNPLMVIPPEATKALKGGGNASEDAPIVENYCYIYRYDEQMRMISRHIPGRAAECFAYDCEGRLAYSRDGNLASQGRRAFTLYDPLGRVAVTGTCADVTDESWWRTPSSTHPAITARRDGTAATGYVWDVALQDVRVLTVNYYDDYTFAAGDTALMGNRSAEARPWATGLLTGTRTAVITPDGAGSGGLDGLSGDYLLTVNYYDAEARLIESRTRRPGTGVLTVSTAYTAGGVPKQTRTALSAGNTEMTYTDDITVDRHGRPVTSVLTAGGNDGSGAAGGCLTWNLGSYGYNGVGRLASVVAQGAMRRNTYYDIHGWVTQWQTPYLSQRLIYGPEAGAGDATPSYTGLITAKITTSGNSERRYNYSYDGLGRLTSAAFTGSIPGADYSTSYSYDLQGNMLRLTRKGLTGPGEYGTVDDVTATYTGNQLHTMRDDAEEVLLEASLDVAAGSYGNDAFDYDANGNLSRDMSRGIAEIEYNELNLPRRVSFADGTYILWWYAADGQKLQQVVFGFSSDVRSVREYVGPYHFTNGRFDRYQLPQGYVTADSVLHAYIPDYQGNIVGVVNTATDTLEQLTDYYPYGLPFADASNPMANRYKYGSKEFYADLGLNTSDFEARYFTPAFPSFNQPDPLAEKYYSLSPYAYCACNPINLIDPTGMDIFELNDKAEIVNVIKTKEFDKIRLVDSEGNPLIDGDGNAMEIEFEYGTVEVTTTPTKDGGTIDTYQIKGDENGKKAFEFLSYNFSNWTEATEFTLTQCGVQGSGMNFISTSHETNVDHSILPLINNKLSYGYTVRNIIHNHPESIYYPSGFGIKKGDMQFLSEVIRVLKQNVRFYIYLPWSEQYIQYDMNSVKSDFNIYNK